MKMFPLAVPALILGLAFGSVAMNPAHAAERFTLSFPSREIAGSLEEAAIHRIKVPFEDGATELSKSAESTFLSDLLRLQNGLPRTGPILVAIEYRAGDAEAADLSYRRLNWLRSAIIAKQAAFSTDRVVIAAFARADAPPGTEVLVLPVELELAADPEDDGGLRAVALDSAFMGPVFIRLDDADDAAVASSVPAGPPPAAAAADPASTSEGQPTTPAAPSEPGAPVDTADAGGEAVQPPAPGTQPSAAVAYKAVWCPAPDRPLDDFYPGGPIVPCGDDRP